MSTVSDFPSCSVLKQILSFLSFCCFYSLCGACIVWHPYHAPSNETQQMTSLPLSHIISFVLLFCVYRHKQPLMTSFSFGFFLYLSVNYLHRTCCVVDICCLSIGRLVVFGSLMTATHSAILQLIPTHQLCSSATNKFSQGYASWTRDFRQSVYLLSGDIGSITGGEQGLSLRKCPPIP